ncbi:MAG: ComF family protein [Phycisphaerales bacterium]|nr:MAG: ComF family protein [Phycisphaerales bacterium]
MSDWLTTAVQQASWFDRIEGVTSVPTHWMRSLTRSFHPAGVIASAVAQQIGLPYLPLLHRVRSGPHQIGLSYTDRVKNVHGAFALRKGIALRKARVLLIDDVKTTGATLGECVKILLRGGASEVYGAVVAQAGWRGALGGPITTA